MLLGNKKTTGPLVTKQPIIATYTIHGDHSMFDGYNDAEVKIWASSEENTLSDDITDRTLVTNLERGDEVELLQHDEDGYYCKVRHATNEGCLDCEWLQ